MYTIEYFHLKSQHICVTFGMMTLRMVKLVLTLNKTVVAIKYFSLSHAFRVRQSELIMRKYFPTHRGNISRRSRTDAWKIKSTLGDDDDAGPCKAYLECLSVSVLRLKSLRFKISSSLLWASTICDEQTITHSLRKYSLYVQEEEFISIIIVIVLIKWTYHDLHVACSWLRPGLPSSLSSPSYPRS